MLEPETLAIFQPLSHDVPPLNLGSPSDTEKVSGLQGEGKDIVDEEDLKIDTFDRDLSTRNLCLVALVTGICLGIFSITFGTRIVISGEVLLPSFLLGKYTTVGNMPFGFATTKAKHYFTGHRVFSMPEAAVLSASLGLNIVVTILFDLMNYIQKCTLRWALWREGRLQYNSNQRLFISAHTFAPNNRYSNAFSCIALIIGYGSTSTLSTTVNIVGLVDQDGFLIRPASSQGWALDVNGWCLTGLGIALLLQGIICTWCLVRSQHVPTWSSNPLNTAHVCSTGGAHLHTTNLVTKDSQRSNYQASREPTSLAVPRPSFPVLRSRHGAFLAMPLPRQQPMWAHVSHAKLLTKLIWAVFSVITIWAVVVGVLGKNDGTCSADYVRKVSPVFDFHSFWQKYCRFVVKFAKRTYTNRRDWLGLIIHSLILSIVTLGLHCAEVITELTRDEAIWRKATTSGAHPMAGSIMQGALSWQCWALFVFKCVAPWIFGYALETSLYVIMSLLPLLTLAALFLLLGLLAEFLVRHKPKGPQPATYGNIDALISLIDEWQNGKIFWGDKGEVTETVRRAGTSGQRLADLQMSFLYQGLRG